MRGEPLHLEVVIPHFFNPFLSIASKPLEEHTYNVPSAPITAEERMEDSAAKRHLRLPSLSMAYKKLLAVPIYKVPSASITGDLGELPRL